MRHNLQQRAQVAARLIPWRPQLPSAVGHFTVFYHATKTLASVSWRPATRLGSSSFAANVLGSWRGLAVALATLLQL